MAELLFWVQNQFGHEAQNPEGVQTVANLMLTLCHQTRYLLDKMIATQEEDFKKHGGVRERMHAARSAIRGEEWFKSVYSRLEAASTPGDLVALADEIKYKDLTLNCGNFRLSCGKEFVNLGNKGFQMMEMLMRSPKVIISADQFMEHIWGWDSEAEINVVWVNISTLRKQLAQIGSKVKINAGRGAGYLLGE